MYSYSFGVNPQLAISMFQLCYYISYISLFSKLCWTCSRVWFFPPPDWTSILALTHAFFLRTTDWHQIKLRGVGLGSSSWFSFWFWRGSIWGKVGKTTNILLTLCKLGNINWQNNKLGKINWQTTYIALLLERRLRQKFFQESDSIFLHDSWKKKKLFAVCWSEIPSHRSIKTLTFKF